MAKKKSTTVSTPEVETKETVKAELEKLIAQWNDSAEFSEYKIMTAIEGKISEKVKQYTDMCEGECFVELKAAENPMLAAAIKLQFETLAVKDEKVKGASGKPTGKVQKTLHTVKKGIDPLRLHKTTKDGIGANKSWFAWIARLDMVLTAASALGLNAVDVGGVNLDFEIVRDTFAMCDEAKSIQLKSESDPSNLKFVLEDVQTVINTMLGEGYTATVPHLNYLLKIHDTTGRGSMRIKGVRERTIRERMLDVCHNAITGEPFIYEYKKAKK